jgi:hypothetical protein
MYTMKEMVLPEDETKIYNKTLATRLEDSTNKEMANAMETSSRTQHETSERASTRE